MSPQATRFPGALVTSIAIAVATGIIQIADPLFVASGAELHGFRWLSWPLVLAGWGFAVTRLGIAVGLWRTRAWAKRVATTVWAIDILVSLAAILLGLVAPGLFTTILWYIWFSISLGPLAVLSVVALIAVWRPSVARALAPRGG